MQIDFPDGSLYFSEEDAKFFLDHITNPEPINEDFLKAFEEYQKRRNSCGS